MPFSGDKRDNLSLQLTAKMENLAMDFCAEKKIPGAEISELLDCNAINRLVRNLGLKVKVESSSTQLPAGLEFVLSGSPPIVL